MQDNNADMQKQGGATPPPSQGGLSWSTPSVSTPKVVQKPVVPSRGPVAAPAASVAQGSSVKKYAGMIAVGIIAGVILAFGWGALREGTSTTETNTTGSETTTKTDAGIPDRAGSDTNLAIPSQAAGTSVAVSQAVVSAPTWIVVYENKDGKPGNALGAGLFFPGGQGGTVELLRATVSGKSYLAVLQVDNGDRKFSLKDDQLLSEGGKVQWVTFEVR